MPETTPGHDHRRGHTALIAGGWGVFAVAVLTVTLSVISLQNYHHNVDSRAHSRTILLAAKDLESSFQDAESAAWRYAIDDAAGAGAYTAATGAMETQLSRLRVLVAGKASQEAKLTELQPLVLTALEHLDHTIEAKRTQGTAAATPHLGSGEGREAIDGGRALLQDVIREENDEITTLTAATDRRAATMTYSVSLLAAVNLLLLAVLGLYLRRKSREEALRRSNEAKDQFVGLVSHELRNPITTIANAVAVLQQRDTSLMKADRDGILRDMANDAARLDRTVANMLLIARLENPEAEFEPVLLQRLIPRVVEQHRRRFPERQVVVRAPDSLPPANGDTSYFEQVLLNLLGNSEKYGDPVAAIEVEVHEDTGGVRVAVLDRGEGINATQAEHLFQPFFRAPSAKRKASGAGLGLAVCKRLVEMQHGRIWAAARPGGGSIFVFTLPRAPEIEPEWAGAGAGAWEAGKTEGPDARFQARRAGP